MERAPRFSQMPDARDPRWVNFRAGNERSRTLVQVSPDAEVKTTWTQLLTRQHLLCDDELTKRPLARKVWQFMNPALPPVLGYSITQTIERQRESAALSIYSSGVDNFNLQTRDGADRVDFRAEYNKTGQLTGVDFHKLTVYADEILDEVQEKSLTDTMEDFAELITKKGPAALYNYMVDYDDAEGSLERVRDIVRSNVDEVTQNWTQEEAARLKAEAAQFINIIWGANLKKQDHISALPEVVEDITNCVFELLPFDYETKGLQERQEIFVNSFGEFVDGILVNNKADLENMGDVYAGFKIGQNNAELELRGNEGEVIYTADTSIGKPHRHEEYEYLVDRTPAGVLVAVQRVIKPIRYEYVIPATANVDQFHKMVEVPTSSGWEDAFNVVRGDYQRK